MYKYNLDPCAPTHILIGDGGNIEGTQTQTIDQAYSTTAACLKPPSTAPPFCATFQVRAPLAWLLQSPMLSWQHTLGRTGGFGWPCGYCVCSA